MIFLVTGATAGFGQAITQRLIKDGHQVIGTGRRTERLNELKDTLGEQFLPLAFDITSLGELQNALASIPESFKPIDVLVNNAGLALGLEFAQEAKLEDWHQMINTNILGLCNITHQLLPEMVKRNQGTIINMGSIAGNYPYPGGNIYGASKAFVKQFSRNLRADLAGKNIRVSNIEPGLCGGTEFSDIRFKGDNEKKEALYANVEYIRPEDVAEIVAWIASQPAHVNISTVEVMPVAQTYAALNVARDI